MLKSVKNWGCFGKMITSIMSMSRQNEGKTGQNEGNVDQSKQNQVKESKKKQRKLDKKNDKNKSKTSKSNQKNQLQQIVEQNFVQGSKLDSRNYNFSKNQQSKYPQITEPVQTYNENQVVPDTQRSLVDHQKQSLSIPQSSENDLPTQKSDIIMNDIGKGVNYNENIFMNRSKEEINQNFESIYQKITLLRSVGFYDQYSIKKKNSKQIFKAYVMKSFEELKKLWNLEEEQETIQIYSELYQFEKTHIENLIALQKSNCPSLLKLIDYELKPPTIDMENDRKFRPGSISLVFQNVQELLEDFLQNNTLDKSDKKRLICQLVSCIKEIHDKKMGVKNLSFRNFYIDQFQNVKFVSMQIQLFGSKSFQIKGNQLQNGKIRKQDIVYLSPQQLGCQKQDQNKENNMRESYFHSGFSVISNFDNISNELAEEQQNLWRLGVMVYKILLGKFICNRQTVELQKRQIQQLLNNKNKETQKSSLKITEKIKQLNKKQLQFLESLLNIDPNSRKTCKQLLQTQYLQNMLQSTQE